MTALQQTPIIPGKASTATVITRDQNGDIVPLTFLVPPGKDAVLPDNLITKDDLQGYLIGVLGTGASDQQGVDVHWNGWADTPELVYGSLSDQKFSNLLGTNAAGLYLTDRGNVVPEMANKTRTLLQSFTATNVQDGAYITFPQPFASDDVQLFITPRTPSNSNNQWIPPLIGYSTLTQSGFNLTRLYADSTPKEWAGDVSILAVGSLG